MTQSPKEQQFLVMILKEIVSQPEKVVITRTVDDMGVLYTLDVAPEDAAKVIGKEGQIAKAIRLLLKTVGYKNKVRASLKINNPRNK